MYSLVNGSGVPSSILSSIGQGDSCKNRHGVWANLGEETLRGSARGSPVDSGGQSVDGWTGLATTPLPFGKAEKEKRNIWFLNYLGCVWDNMVYHHVPYQNLSNWFFGGIISHFETPMEGMQYGEIFQRQGGSHHLGVSINEGSPIASIAGWWFHGKSQSKMDDLGVPPLTETIIVFLNEGWSWRNRNPQGRSFGPFGRWKCWELSCSTWYKWARDVCMRPTMVVMVVTIYEDMLSFMIINL